MATSGPLKNKAGFEIKIDRDQCVTLAVCIGVARKTFELDAEGKAVISDPNAEDITTIVEAAKGCPVNAIFVKHPNGKRIWPDPEVDIEGNAL